MSDFENEFDDASGFDDYAAEFSSDLDLCAHALRNVHAFLHGELSEEEADMIRRHLSACERCIDNFRVEEQITKLIQRCCEVHASDTLRVRVRALITSNI
ncbi:MAG: zf-HC2 domain-containing protein [Propionibacteriaceae bacterium]|jgi:anti-sigma factor (TIGR02949 family)|nr:zf-HC2 domain-containing protein [Propionibacteriaceae bacterium]